MARFTSRYPQLAVWLGRREAHIARFVDGVYDTDDEQVAEVLRRTDGVTEDESSRRSSRSSGGGRGKSQHRGNDDDDGTDSDTG
jgi:hypothetical protein